MTVLQDLNEAAREARKRSYSPFSGFKVGAAVLTQDDEIYSACNVECKPSSNILHAEQRAIAKAVEAGDTELEALSLVTDEPGLLPPCGNCRNMMASIQEDITVIVADKDSSYHEIFQIEELLPRAYTGRDKGEEHV